MDKLIGRYKEVNEIKRAVASLRSELIIVYGRRRIGKTFLIRKIFNDTYTFHYVGAHRQTKKKQLEHFGEALVKYFSCDISIEIDNWHSAFLLLEKCLEKSTDKRKIIFFDEMPWADTQGSEFVSEFEYF